MVKGAKGEAGAAAAPDAMAQEGEGAEQAAPLLQHHPAAPPEEPHPRPPATRSSFYGTLEMFEDDAALLDDSTCAVHAWFVEA